MECQLVLTAKKELYTLLFIHRYFAIESGFSIMFFLIMQYKKIK